MSIDHWEKEKQKTTTVTIKISRLPFVMLVSAVLVLSSVAAAQLFMSDNINAAFAAVNCDSVVTEETDEYTCVGGSGGGFGFQEGGGGGRQTCTTDISTDISTADFGDDGGTSDSTCTTSGGHGFHSEDFGTGGEGFRQIDTIDSQGRTITQTGGHGGTNSDSTGGGGGQTTCTHDSTSEDFDCTTLAGGGGSKPVPEEGG